MSALAEWLRLDGGTLPEVAVEISARAVAAASVELRGGRPVLTSCAAEALSAGAITPHLDVPNIRDLESVSAALERVLDRVGRPGRVGLVIPDAVARVSHLVLQQPPSSAADLDQVLRWQVKKSMPFPIEQAQMSYARGAASPQGQEFLVTVARRAVVEEYEALCLRAGAHPGIVDLSTISVINAALAGNRQPTGDWLLVHVSSDAVSLAVVRGAITAFFRTQQWDGAVSLGDLVHQTTMYYEDRLSGVGFERVLVSGAASAGLSTGVDQVCREIGEHARHEVEVVDVRETVTLVDRITPSASLLDALAPLAGLLLAQRASVAA